MDSVRKTRWMGIAFLSGLLVLSCGSRKVTDFEKARRMDHYMDSWVGHYKTELISRWGPPTETMPGEKGGSLLVYESLKGIWGDAKDKRVEGGLHYPTGKRQQGYAAKRVFYVDENGIIYDWRWSGL